MLIDILLTLEFRMIILGDLFELLASVGGSTADTLLDILQGQISDDIDITIENFVHALPNVVSIGLVLLKVVLNGLIPELVLRKSTIFVSRIPCLKFMIFGLVDHQHIFHEQLITDDLLPDRICQINAEWLTCQETEGQQPTDESERVIIFIVDSVVQDVNLVFARQPLETIDGSAFFELLHDVSQDSPVGAALINHFLFLVADHKWLRLVLVVPEY